MDHSRIMAPALTTIHVPAFEVGRRAAQALLDRIEDRRVESALIESELAVRESTARCEERTKDEG
jgi:DNA-binding LacI/PurR family transcriptional regulator